MVQFGTVLPFAGWRSVTALLVLSVIFSGLLVHGDPAPFTYADFGLNWNGTCKDGLRQSPINVEKSLFTRPPSSPPVPAGTFGTGTNVSVSGHAFLCLITALRDSPSAFRKHAKFSRLVASLPYNAIYLY